MSPLQSAGETAFEGLITVHSEAPARDGCTWAWNWCATPGPPSLYYNLHFSTFVSCTAYPYVKCMCLGSLFSTR